MPQNCNVMVQNGGDQKKENYRRKDAPEL